MLFLTHRNKLLIATGMLIPILFGLSWLSALLIVPFAIMLTGKYLSARWLHGKVQSVVTTGSKLLLLIAYTIICKLYVFDIYQVNSSSMEGTLIKGDVLFINKLAYGPQQVNHAGTVSWVKLFGDSRLPDQACSSAGRKKGYTAIRRNDVFIYELFPGYFVVKRCVGLPGDHLRVSNDTPFVNNRIVDFPSEGLSHYRLQFADHAGLRKYVSRIARTAIDSINIDSNIIIANLSAGSLPKSSLQVTRLPNKPLPGKAPYFLPEVWTINNLGPMTIPHSGLRVSQPSLYRHTVERWECNTKPAGYVFKENYYFMMGDNKPYSEDSRYLGLIPENKIVGKVAFIVCSYNEKGFMWNRLFKSIL